MELLTNLESKFKEAIISYIRNYTNENYSFTTDPKWVEVEVSYNALKSVDYMSNPFLELVKSRITDLLTLIDMVTLVAKMDNTDEQRKWLDKSQADEETKESLKKKYWEYVKNVADFQINSPDLITPKTEHFIRVCIEVAQYTLRSSEQQEKLMEVMRTNTTSLDLRIILMNFLGYLKHIQALDEQRKENLVNDLENVLSQQLEGMELIHALIGVMLSMEEANEIYKRREEEFKKVIEYRPMVHFVSL